MNDERLSLLVNHYLDGQLAPDELAELEELLRSSAASRGQFWRESRLHALLYEVEDVAAQRASPRNRIARPRRFGIAVALVAAAACVALISALVTWYWPRHITVKEQPVAVTETTTTAVALLTRTLDVRWSDPANTHKVGEALEPGWLRLKTGLAYVEFFNGVGMVLEGPAEVQLISVRKVFCRSGRLNVDVPPVARGYTVCTPQLQVVDLGTTFGLYVRDKREEVHVFKGKVTFQVASAKPRDLNQGEAMAVAGDGKPQMISSNQVMFMSAAELERKSDALQGRQLQAWREASARSNADPSLMLRFDFEHGSISDRSLRNLAAHGVVGGDATIVGCANAEGRWPGKDALEFRNLSDRVRVSVPGEHRALTLVTWVRVDRLECLFNSLFMADAFEPGAVHWQIRSNGSLHLGVSGPTNEHAADYNYDSPKIFTADKLGRWTQLAMVYDGAKRQMTQYMDGQPIGRCPVKQAVTLRIGHGELGNWNPGVNSPDPTPVRYLSGRMDEFDLFNRALSDQEILSLYKMSFPKPAEQRE
jgi:hypothetical protein